MVRRRHHQGHVVHGHSLLPSVGDVPRVAVQCESPLLLDYSTTFHSFHFLDPHQSVEMLNLFDRKYYGADLERKGEHLQLNNDVDVAHQNVRKAELEPGTAYRFRVAGINSLGRGWLNHSSIFFFFPASLYLHETSK